METRDYLKYIVEEIHSTVFATVDKEGRPVTCAIDIMDYDESGLYFLTAKGKNFYDRLKMNENIAFTAMKGEDTLSCVAVSVQGKVKEIGPDKLPELFKKNPYMEKIYPDVSSRSALTVFKIYEGTNLMLPLNSLIFATIVIIAYSFLISGLCIAIASRSKTFKEAQSALTPLTFISFFPSMIAFMMNVESNAILSCIPFLNFTLLFTDIVNENLNLINMILMILSTLIIIAVVLKIIIAQYKSEKVLFNQ